MTDTRSLVERVRAAMIFNLMEGPEHDKILAEVAALESERTKLQGELEQARSAGFAGAESYRTAAQLAIQKQRDLESKLAMALDAARKGDEARAVAGGMEMEIAELKEKLAAVGEIAKEQREQATELREHRLNPFGAGHIADHLNSVADRLEALATGAATTGQPTQTIEDATERDRLWCEALVATQQMKDGSAFWCNVHDVLTYVQEHKRSMYSPKETAGQTCATCTPTKWNTPGFVDNGDMVVPCPDCAGAKT